MIFTYFAVPTHFQKRVLMIGIIGAIVLRTVMILVGGCCLAEFHWVLYVFGAFLILTASRCGGLAGKEPDLNDNPALKLLRKLLLSQQELRWRKVLDGGKRKKIATPLFMVICLIGTHRRDFCGRLHPPPSLPSPTTLSLC
jgi:tellurite resistance protein TerC